MNLKQDLLTPLTMCHNCIKSYVSLYLCWACNSQDSYQHGLKGSAVNNVRSWGCFQYASFLLYFFIYRVLRKQLGVAESLMNVSSVINHMPFSWYEEKQYFREQSVYFTVVVPL